LNFIATFDVGTTAIKGVLLSEDRICVCEKSISYETLFTGGYKEQRPKDWYTGFLEITQLFIRQIDSAESITAIIMSGQMQDLIMLDQNLESIGNAILYSDSRAVSQAELILSRIGHKNIGNSTANSLDATMPFSKLLWISQHQPNRYKRIHKVVFSAKDYLVAQLTGEAVTDVTTASTVGLIDIKKKSWNSHWMTDVDLNASFLPKSLYCHEIAGYVTKGSAEHTGYCEGTPVYAGAGDAGATTLASGTASHGQFSINIGTTGHVAYVTDHVEYQEGVFHLASIIPDSYICAVPFLNAGNVHQWVSGVLSPETCQSRYQFIGDLLLQHVPGSGGVMFLPYMIGERFPVVDPHMKGCFVGLTPETSQGDLAGSVLEGVAFSLRQGIERFKVKPIEICLVGGGAKTKRWCQIFADILGYPVRVCLNSEYLPSVALSSSVQFAKGMDKEYDKFLAEVQNVEHCIWYDPDPEAVRQYNKMYPLYLKMYPLLRQMYEGVC